MGKKKTKTEQTNKPIYSAQIEGAANTQQQAYNQAKPGIDRFSDNSLAASEDLFAQYKQGDPTIGAARGYIESTLGSDPQNNPYLDDMVGRTNDNLQRRIRTQMGTRGNLGGTTELDILGRALSDSELGMRYNDYGQQMNRKAQAAGMAPGVVAGSYLPLDAAMRSGSAGAMMPLQAALANSAGVGGLLGQYQNVKGTQQQTGGLFGDLLKTAAQIGSAAIMACDERLKENVERVGETPGGVPLYRFDYIGGERGVVGPMAQEVALLQPGALGPVIDGYMTVNVGALQ